MSDFISFLDSKPKDDREARMISYSLKSRLASEHTIDRGFYSEVEFGLGNVFAVKPYGYPDWHRRDDAIDYLEETENHGQRNFVSLFNRPLYPWDIYMDGKTGAPYCHGSEMHSMVNFLLQKNQEDQVSSYLVERGFSSLQEFKDTVVPFVPYDVRYMCEWAGIFQDPTTIFSLRPMLYVFWA